MDPGAHPARAGTARAFTAQDSARLRTLVARVADGVAATHGVEATAELAEVAIPTVSADAEADFVLLGACPPDRDPATAPSNHSPFAVFDDAVIERGIRFETEWAIARLDALANCPPGGRSAGG
ncbi:hypothetical protein [Nocardia sp. NBC_01329]|uniref:hypothetical protein n=1 Tax=Nocardia sp. NBC_01329 TaxID=2903594 RepID=UPI002E143DF8|nr:hypothetical protein OG405_12140 [Nocardia sp. NBC_01329]